jgi:[acyl-carrier-protein] S-malonyltransferase
VECGPGKVLSGLNKRINRDLRSYALAEVADFNKALETLKQGG